jgi:hypothetical protein
MIQAYALTKQEGMSHYYLFSSLILKRQDYAQGPMPTPEARRA